MLVLRFSLGKSAEEEGALEKDEEDVGDFFRTSTDVIPHIPLLLQVQKKSRDIQVKLPSPFFPPSKTQPPRRVPAVFLPRLGAPVTGGEGEVTPGAILFPLLQVSGDVGFGPSFVGLQGHNALFAQRGDLSPAARRLRGPGRGGGRGGGRGRAEVDERGSDQLLRGKSVEVVLDCEAVVESHRVGAELPVLFGPAVRFCSALVETQHELQVLVRFLLVRQRSVVRAFVPRGALLTTPASLRLAWPRAVLDMTINFLNLTANPINPSGVRETPKVA
ncbi:hypothetical protein F7725_004829 [Dissostichus mawsoni]|uniref:Uncharacterized protein n=1 Tax=Dissostichus mawsoni TaxID=36200 RepID=A0A7J5XJX4_DISMA|nr:hypothetical protein F7725_004829 [Dissostichus mawsoni]